VQSFRSFRDLWMGGISETGGWPGGCWTHTSSTPRKRILHRGRYSDHSGKDAHNGKKEGSDGSKGLGRQIENEVDPPSPAATMSDTTTPTSSRPTNARLPSLAQIAARQVH
jgi:hypothetical protein